MATQVIYTFRTKPKVWRIHGLQASKSADVRILKASVELLDRLDWPKPQVLREALRLLSRSHKRRFPDQISALLLDPQ
jgi:hypothetical protein